MAPAPSAPAESRGPLLTCKEFEQLQGAREAGAAMVECSMDLERSTSRITLGPDVWLWNGRPFPYPERLKERTVYHYTDTRFEPIARYASSFIKLVPTPWGAPTFEIDGIKMLPSQKISPWADAERKVELIRPRGKVVLDTCGGLGYFAAWCVRGQARQVQSYEKNSDVLWLRTLNPWSPPVDPVLRLVYGDVIVALGTMASGSIDAILHDPPRFGIAGELYSQEFYASLARVLKRRGLLFHYTGQPNRLSGGRDLPAEVAQRLRRAGFTTTKAGDGILAARR